MPRQKLLLVGGGNMGRALLRGMLGAGVFSASDVSVVDVDAGLLEEIASEHGVATSKELSAEAPAAHVIILAVKPFILGDVLDLLANLAPQDALFVSIVAGVSSDDIARRLSAAEPGSNPARSVVRAMPNLPATVQAGASALCATPDTSGADLDLAERILASVGHVARVAEGQMDAVTGLSGSGPAFLFLVIEALADGGVEMGLPRATALELATRTVLGAARLVEESGLHPGVLKDRVATPGGTTIAGIRACEEGALRATMMAAVEAATERSRELGESARRD